MKVSLLWDNVLSLSLSLSLSFKFYIYMLRKLFYWMITFFFKFIHIILFVILRLYFLNPIHTFCIQITNFIPHTLSPSLYLTSFTLRLYIVLHVRHIFYAHIGHIICSLILSYIFFYILLTFSFPLSYSMYPSHILYSWVIFFLP